MGRESKPIKKRTLPTILPEIRSLIEMSRRHAAVTANLALVNLYWNIGRVITRDIQRNEKRAGYGEQLLSKLASLLTKEYGQGYSKINLQDMRRFYELFRIDQTLSSKSSEGQILQALSGEFPSEEIQQALPAKSSSPEILQPVPAESSDRIPIEFGKHFRLGWSHCRLLLSQNDSFKRKFYFEQAGTQRWSVRELRRQIDGALFERVALSRNTRKLVALEKCLALI